MSAQMPRLQSASGTRPRTAATVDGVRPLLPVAAARIVSFAALAIFAGLHWARLVAPAASAPMVVTVAIAVVAAAAVSYPGRARRLRPLLVAVALLAATLGALVAGGVPVGLLKPAAWSELADALWQGLTILPDLRTPYVGADEWPRIVIVAGGALLILAAGLMSCRPSAGSHSRLTAALTLAVVYGIPAVQIPFASQTARGAAFAVLLAAFLWLERIPRRGGPAALGFVVAAVAIGVLAAPLLDSRRAWIDYEQLAASVGPRAGVSFDFDHGYGPIDWPRDGRQVLRIKARAPAYWKAANLDRFDGLRWRRIEPAGSRTPSLTDELPAGWERRASWRQDVGVTIRSLKSDEVIAAGATIEIARAPHAPIPAGSPGEFRLDEPLQRGDSYVASVYAPRPSAAQLAAAGTTYPGFTGNYLTLDLPPTATSPNRQGDERAPPYFTVEQVRFAPFGIRGLAPLRFSGGAVISAAPMLRRSAYARAWALAQGLRARAATPYAFVRSVEAYLGRGFTYTEAPPVRAVPLESFLFEDRRGYCQQFSGAMALLLRMGGVPARVAGGFSPGSYSSSRSEYVVRDIDAHSWVEAWFPGIGWATFDPTPAAAPARLQLTLDTPEPGGSGTRIPGLARLGDRPESGGPSQLNPGGPGGGFPWLWLVAGVLAATFAAGLAWLLRHRQRRTAAPAQDPWLAELTRALRRAGREPAPSTTLRGLERELRTPEAAGYVRAVRTARYGTDPSAPTPDQRRGLRRELARGGGLPARLRAVWAVPPWAPRPAPTGAPYTGQ